jgi:ketosteroid isomerase-like protein
MDTADRSLTALAGRVKTALGTGDSDSFRELLDPGVHWGPPGDPSPPCQNREQVIAWYERAKDAGASAVVSEVSVVGDRIVVGLVVAGTGGARARGGHATRWQVLSVANGRIADIVGFEEKQEALAWVEAQPG